jgi:hypothetical protein
MGAVGGAASATEFPRKAPDSLDQAPKLGGARFGYGG